MRGVAVVAMLATVACAPARVPDDARPRPAAAIALRSPRHVRVDLIGASALPDGGVVVVGDSHDGIVTAAGVRCTPPEGSIFIARFDVTGGLRWSRCLVADGWGRERLAIASDLGVWVVHTVRATHPTAARADIFDLAVVDRFGADGTALGARPLITWRGPTPRDAPSLGLDLAHQAGEAIGLTHAALAGGELVVAGTGRAGAMADGAWQTSGYTGMTGFVLGQTTVGVVRPIFAAGGTVIVDVAVAGRRFAATGWCGSGAEVQLCAGTGTSAFVVHGTIGDRTPLVHLLGEAIYDTRVAIDDDGTVIAGGSAWQPIELDRGTVSSTCTPFAFAAAWTAVGLLRYARSLGECAQPEPRPGAPPDHVSDEDRTSSHGLGVTAITVVGTVPTIAVAIGEDSNHLDWPVRLDGAALKVPFGNDLVLVGLDPAGRILRQRWVRFDSVPVAPDQPDASLASEAGVVRAIVTTIRGRGWIAIAHGGGVALGTTHFPLVTRLHLDRDDVPRVGDEIAPACDPRAIHARPSSAAIAAAQQDASGEPEDFGCRHAVHVEIGVDLIPW